jgi:hypothetical protein
VRRRRDYTMHWHIVVFGTEQPQVLGPLAKCTEQENYTEETE